MKRMILVGFCILCQGVSAVPEDIGASFERLLSQRKQELGLSEPIKEVARVAELREKLKALGPRASKIHVDKKARAQQLAQLDTIMRSSEHLMLNPYKNPEWQKKARAVANRFCCLVQKNPDMAETIAENVKAGRRPTDGLKKK